MCNYNDVIMTSKKQPVRSSDPTKARTVTAIRLPIPLHERLRDAADDRDLSVNFLVVKALEEFLDRLIPADELRLTRDPARTHAA
jgi:predicted HicB family RNase H-like nuclease